MASDGSRKFKEKRSRGAKPYDRPKGLIRRVTDSVTGLFGSSWLSGWIAGEEEEDAADSQASLQPKTEAPPGESFIFAQPVRQSFRPIYPEEGEIESSNQHIHGINVGASTSAGSGLRMNLTTPSVVLPTAPSLSTDNLSPVGRRQPIISSTPAGPQMFTRTKSQLEPRPVPLLTSATQTGDDASEFSESSVETGVDASVIPRPDERDYQREILQLDDESLQTLRENVPAAAASQPTIEETRKRPRETEPDQASSRAEGSISNRSLFSESGEISLSQPQPSALASKRPRFNVSAYGSPLMHDRSILSDSSFRMSPFYPGKTMYGGASAYRRGRLSRPQTPRVQIKPKPAQSSDDGGLSQTARRILECLEQMSTPISDAKRIPIPVAGHRSSFLDASGYTAVYHKQRQTPRNAGPPSTNRSLPAKAPSSTVCSCAASKAVVSTTDTAAVVTSEASTSEPLTSISSQVEEERHWPAKKWGESPPLSIVPKPPEAAAAHLRNMEKAGGKVKSKVVTSGRASTRQEMFDAEVQEVKLPSVPLSLSSLPVINLTQTRSATPPLQKDAAEFSFSSPLVVHGDEVPSDISSVSPVFTFRSPSAVVGQHSTAISTSASSPSVLLHFNSCTSSTAPKLKDLSKRKPSTIISKGELKEGSILDILKPKSASSPDKSSSWLSPVVNNIEGKSLITETRVSTKVDEPNLGLNFEQNTTTVNSLSKNTDVSSTFSFASSSTSSSSTSTSTTQAFQGFSSFMKSSDEWECSVCMIRNKNTLEECVACKTLKPGLNSNSSSTSTADIVTKAVVDQLVPASNSVVGGWGNAFKKSDNEWECETCMLRNKDSSDKCVACETPKPGCKSDPKLFTDSTSKVIENKVEKTNIGFGTIFAKAKGEWECDTCLVRNKSEASKCSCCDAPKPGATAAVSQAITGNFKFGVDIKNSSTSSFKFGVPESESEVKSSVFKFGVSAKNTTGEGLDKSKGSVGMGEQTKLNNLTEVSKGEGVSNSSTNVNFTFGIKPSEQKENGNKLPDFFSSSELNESKAEPASAIKFGVSFGAVSSPKTGFNFTATSDAKQGKKERTETASQLKQGSVTDVLKSSASTTTTTSLFTFGSNANKSEEKSSVKSSSSIFNHSLTGLHKDSTTVTTPSFGSLTGKDSGFSATAPVFGSKPTESTSTTAITNTSTSSSNSFPSGNQTNKASELPPYNFFSPISTESKPLTMPAPVPSFTFGSKGDAPTFGSKGDAPTFGSKGDAPTFGSKDAPSDADDSHKKMSFGIQSTNNNIKSSPKLFTFGSKENTTSFAPAPNATPAFGAPAPTMMSTPFQFGQNNNPTPAATAPAQSFGNASTPAFGSNDSKPAFAFGQGPQKSGAGYDFGQAANSFPAPVFNFGAKQSDASATIFQFGNANSAEPPSFGGENAFPPAPPSGRVVKKARRRRQ